MTGRRIALVLAGAWLAVGCATAPQGPSAPVVWPSPPEPPRIE